MSGFVITPHTTAAAAVAPALTFCGRERHMAHVGAENAAAAGTAAAGRKSPRLGAVGGGASGLTARGLQDITNIAGSRNLQAFGKTKQAICESHVPTPAGLAPLPSTTGSRLGAFGAAAQLSQQQKQNPVASSSSASVFQTQGGAVKDASRPECPQSVREYVTEIVDLLFQDEASFLPSPNYIETQTDINGKMRAILIDWLVEVHMKYRLRPETLGLTVNLIDRYLSRVPVLRKRLQLVGVVAMLIAAKYEEITPPEIRDYVYITDNAYTKKEVLDMECEMLTSLEFQITVPTAVHFLDRLTRVNECDAEHREVVQYIVELSLLDIRMIRYTPSHLVSAAILLSNELMGRPVKWPPAMVQHSRQEELALRPCAEELRVVLEQAPQSSLQAVCKKYALQQHHCVAKMNFGGVTSSPSPS